MEIIDKAIDMCRSFDSIVISAVLSCKKLNIDISKIKKIDKVYSMYGIPRNEKIIAYCKGNTPLLPITREGIIFTDHAIHFYATLEKNTGSKIRNIAYSEFGRFIFTQAGAKGNICAHSADRDVQIFGGTIFLENVSGAEILKVVKEIQNILRQRDASIDADLEKLASSIIEDARCNIHITELPQRLDTILDAIIFDHHFSTTAIDEAATVKAEYLFRQCDAEKYSSFVESLPSLNVSFDTRQKLVNIPESFVSNFVSILKNSEEELDSGVLSKCFNRLDDIESLSKQYQIIRAYMGIRMNEIASAECSIKQLRNQYGDDEANQIEWFKGIFCYQQMQKVYDILHNQEKLTNAYASYRDGLGLTPLHYALILKNEDAISCFLEKSTWKNKMNFPKHEILSLFYDYILLACGKQVSNIENLLEKTHPETIKVKKRVDKLQKRIKELNIKLQIQKTNLSIGRSKRASLRMNDENAETIAELTEKIEALTGYIEETIQSIQEYASELQVYEEELATTMENAIHDALDALGTMKECTDPLAQYLYRLYFEPNFFEYVLHEINEQNDLKLYQYDDFYFVAPAFAGINLPCLEQHASGEKSKQAEYVADKPLYGTSWFSYEAHHRVDVLKSEYRKLAKNYHPDVCKLPNCTELFKAISTEYSQIYDLIENK